MPSNYRRGNRQSNGDRTKVRRLLNPGSSSEFELRNQTEALRGVPTALLRSVAWEIQCDSHRDGRRNGVGDVLFAAMLELRASYFMKNRPLCWYGLDQAFLRFAREEGYAARIAALRDEGVDGYTFEEMHPSCLLDDPPVLRTGWPKVSTEMTRVEMGQTMPADWRRCERVWRDKFGVLAGCHQVELRGLTDAAIQARNPLIPRSWAPIATSYFLDVETPAIATYLGRELSAYPASPWWHVAKAEFVRNTAVAALYWARQGKLPWMSEATTEAIRRLGVGLIFKNHLIAAEFNSILREVELVNWPAVAPRNRLLPPGGASMHTPVFENGDWIRYDPVAQESRLESDMYVEEGDNGMAKDGRPSRGLQFTGSVEDAEQTEFALACGMAPQAAMPRVHVKPRGQPAGAAGSSSAGMSRTAADFFRRMWRFGTIAKMTQKGFAAPQSVEDFCKVVNQLLDQSPGPQAQGTTESFHSSQYQEESESAPPTPMHSASGVDQPMPDVPAMATPPSAAAAELIAPANQSTVPPEGNPSVTGQGTGEGGASA